MSVEPLFVGSREKLKERLRLQQVTEHGEYSLDQAIERVRGLFYRKLGGSTVSTLLAIAYEENTTDETKILRTIANTTEVAWITAELLSLMPFVSGDAGGGTRALWNTEGVWNHTGEEERRAKIAHFTKCVNESLDLLKGIETLGNEVNVRTFVSNENTVGGPWWPTLW